MIFVGSIHVEVEAKNREELGKILDKLVNAKLPKEVEEKLIRMSYETEDFTEYTEE